MFARLQAWPYVLFVQLTSVPMHCHSMALWHGQPCNLPLSTNSCIYERPDAIMHSLGHLPSLTVLMCSVLTV